MLYDYQNVAIAPSENTVVNLMRRGSGITFSIMVDIIKTIHRMRNQKFNCVQI